MSDDNIEEMSPARRKMLAKLGKLPAEGEDSTSVPVVSTTEPVGTSEVGDLGDVSPSRRKILAKLGRLPTPASASVPKQATATKNVSRSTSSTSGELHPIVTGKIKRSVKPKLEFKFERRGWLAMAAGWSAFLLGGIPAFATMILRYLFPNVLFEPPQSFKIGYPDEFEIGKVDLRFKKEFSVWIVRNEIGMYALSTVCTHLGCTPNWLDTERKFKCPCHGSGFRPTGINFEGPAPRPLERFKIYLADDGQIIVDKTKNFKFEKGEWERTESFLKV